MRRFSSLRPVFRTHKSSTKTRFPAKYNPDRSAFKQKFVLPAGVSYNPAPAPPTPLETPAAFLPADERAARSFVKDAGAYDVASMPALSPAPRRTYHLTQADADEIARLRLADPAKWTRPVLAQKFKVSEFVVGMVSRPSPEHAREMQSRLETIQAQWNEDRTRARKHRKDRKQLWLRDA